MIALKGRNENAMPHWKFDVTETLTQTSHYVVEAATYDLARRKAAIGDTVSEEKIRVHGVQDRDPQRLGPCDAQGNDVDELPHSKRYCVDGHEFENHDSELLGDGQFPPFYIFDIQEQDNLPGSYPTRKEAEAVMQKLIPVDDARPVVIRSSNGDFQVNRQTGEVISQEGPDKPAHEIARFDLAE